MNAIWTARCKSGYQFRSARTGKLATCNKVCSRGQLLCSDCHSAVVVPQVAQVSNLWNWYARVYQTVASMIRVQVRVLAEVR